MNKIILILAIFLVGCAQISNNEIIEETKKCEEAGLNAEKHFNGWTHNTTEIVCSPRKNNY